MILLLLISYASSQFWFFSGRVIDRDDRSKDTSDF